MICLKLVTKGEYSSFPLLSVVSVCMFERTQTNPRLYNMTQYANERSCRCSRLKCLEFNMRDYSGGWTKPGLLPSHVQAYPVTRWPSLCDTRHLVATGDCCLAKFEYLRQHARHNKHNSLYRVYSEANPIHQLLHTS